MADPHVISSLRAKIKQTERAICSYEQAILKARQDLTALGLSLKVFEMENGTPDCFSPALSVSKLFRRGEVAEIAEEALRAAPDGLDTRQLAVVCLEA